MDLAVHVVWVPMIGSDTEEAAIEMAAMFDDPRVVQYWDPDRLVGTSYGTHVFPNYVTDLANELVKALPPDHWWHQSPSCRADPAPGKAPLWDVVFVYGRGDDWRVSPPTPAAMTKQIFFYGASGNGPSGMFFRDFRKPPIESDWVDEVRHAVQQVFGDGQAKAEKEGDPRLKRNRENCSGKVSPVDSE